MGKKIPIHGGWIVATVVGCVATMLYFTAVDPYMHPDKWTKIQNDSRARLDQNRLHPYDNIMNRWTNPWESDDKKESK